MFESKSEASYLILEDRGVIALEGVDARDFLQGLISNDVNRVSANRAIWAALLTPQGKFLFDFFIAEMPGPNGALVLDCEAARLIELKKKLTLYKLRSRVEVRDASADFRVAAAFGDGALGALGLADTQGAAIAFGGGVAFTDPRLAKMGGRAILAGKDAEAALGRAGLKGAARADYDALRIPLGLPDGAKDMTPEKAILLENGFDELGGVDWNKGCYMGQELTARTKYRGLIKKRLMPVTIEGPAPEPGTPVLTGGKEAGEMRSSAGNIGLALMRLEHIDAAGAGPRFTAGEATVTPRLADWMQIHKAEEN